MFPSRQIGSTGVKVTPVSLGCSCLSRLYEEVSAQQARDVLTHAWARGIRYFDVAPLYGLGLSETRLGQFLQTRPRIEAVVSTKVGRILEGGEVQFDYSAAGFQRSLEESLRRLGLDRVDMLYVHDIGEFTHGTANAAHMEDLLGSGLPYLERLKREGAIGAYGVGANETETLVEILHAHPLDAVLIAGRWTLLDRSAEAELVPLCARTKTSIVLGGIFNSGILATGPSAEAHFNYLPADSETRARVRTLQERCAALGVEMPHAALQFAATRPQVASVLMGTETVPLLQQNLDALDRPLPAEAAERLFSH